MPCPHNEITIVQRSKRQSAVASAAYQSGERLFSEYDQKQKYYSHKSEIVHTEIMLPPHAPPEYADRNTLWNAAEAVEKQWNSQLARRFVLAIPRELPRSQYADLIRDYCREFFVSKGMIADYAIHDPHPPGHNPHAHILLTMRAMDETGKWLPKSRKVYDLDENGERIKLPSGRWKSHKEDTVDWNDQKYAEIWRQGWADTANRYLEANDCPERLDLRSYARQGIDKIPTVHMGPAVSQLEKKGIQTNIGNLNRDIKAANSLMQSIRQMVRSLKGWLSGLKEKKAALLEALEQAKEPTIPELLSRYLDMRSEERTGWTSKGKLKGTVGDFNKVMEALDFLRQKEISTVESLDAYLDEASAQAVSIREEIRPMEKRVKEIDRLLFHIGNFEANKPVHAEYAAIRFKKPKEQFAAAHRDELDAYNAAVRYFKVHLEGTKYSTKKLNEERTQLAGEVAEYRERLSAVQEDVKILRDVRHWLNQVLPSEQYRQTAEPGKKPSIQQAVKGRAQRIREEQAEKRQQPRTDPELLSRYLDMRSEERTGWTSKGQLKGTVNDFNKVMDAIRYLREKELSTVESLDAYLDTVSGQAVSIRAEMKPKEKRMKEVDTMLSHIANFEAHKPVHAEYAAIRFKKPKEQFAAAHRDELDTYNAAVRYFKVHLEGTKYSTKKLNEERTQLAGEVAEYRERLSAVQEDVKILRDVRHWLNQVLPSEQYRQTAEPGKKPSIQQAVKGRAQRIREEQAEKRQQPRTEKKQDMEL